MLSSDLAEGWFEIHCLDLVSGLDSSVLCCEFSFGLLSVAAAGELDDWCDLRSVCHAPCMQSAEVGTAFSPQVRSCCEAARI